jgi:hypothetical protein
MCGIKSIVKETGTNFHRSVCLLEDCLSMYRVFCTFGRLPYVTLRFVVHHVACTPLGTELCHSGRNLKQVWFMYW